MAHLEGRLHMKVNEEEKARWKALAAADPRVQAITDPDRRLSAWVRIVLNETADAAATKESKKPRRRAG